MKVSSLLHPDVVGIYVGIIGIVLACVFYVRSKEQMRPCILIERTTLIGKSDPLFPESVEVHYNGMVIPALSKVRITFWNAGRRTLDHSDIAENDPIAIKFPESKARILDIRSVITTRNVIDSKLLLRDNSIFISFDFLEQNDGLAFEVFYDSGSETDVSLYGTIKGVPGGIAVRKSEDTVLRTGPDVPGAGLMLFGGFLLMLALSVPINLEFKHWNLNLLDVVSGIAAAVLGAFILPYGVYRYFQGRIPRALRANSQVVKSVKVEKLAEDPSQS